MDALPPDLDPGKTLEFLEELIAGCSLDPEFAALVPRLEVARERLEKRRAVRLGLERERRRVRPRVERKEYELRGALRTLSNSVQSTDPRRLAGLLLALFPEGFTREIVRSGGSKLLARGTAILELLGTPVPFLAPLPAPRVQALRERERELRAALALRDSVTKDLAAAMLEERSAADDAACRVQWARDEMRRLSAGDLERARAAYPRSLRRGGSAPASRNRPANEDEPRSRRAERDPAA